MLGEPKYDKAVQQHRHRCGPFDRPPCPSLRFLEPEMLFAVMIHHFDRPTHRVPGEHLLRAGIGTPGIKGLFTPPFPEALRWRRFEATFSVPHTFVPPGPPPERCDYVHIFSVSRGGNVVSASPRALPIAHLERGGDHSFPICAPAERRTIGRLLPTDWLGRSWSASNRAGFVRRIALSATT